MPKIKKIKFQDTGEVHPDTTFTGYVTLDIYFDSKYEFFYFQEKDIKSEIKTLPEDWKMNYNYFRQCRSVKEATTIISFLIKDFSYYKSEKYLAIKIKGDNHTIKHKNYNFENVYNNGCDVHSGLEIGYEYFLKIIHPMTGETVMCKCLKNWTLERKNQIYNATGRYHFVKWSEHREAVLNNAIQSLKIISGNVLKMFDDAIDSNSIESVLDNNSKNLIDK